MKKIGIITIFDNDNYGNRLQNYAVQKQMENNGFEVETIKNLTKTNNLIKKSLKSKLKLNIILLMKIFKDFITIKTKRRYRYFKQFNKDNIKTSKNYITGNNAHKIENNYDYFIVGSDQVWNPNFRKITDIDFLNFTNTEKKIAFSVSFGVAKFPEDKKNQLKKKLQDFGAISVREESGKEIIKNIVGREDVDVLVDPTMLLTDREWEKISKKPKQLKTNKYILNYFLGELSESRKKEIERVAKENNCQIINLLDKNSPFYQTGPSEFLYLEKNAFLICTDSFHSCVFAILFDIPFLVFEREGKGNNMNTRIETLLSKFHLEDRKFLNEITKENLKHNYSKTYKILEEERKKSNNFLRKVLNAK